MRFLILFLVASLSNATDYYTIRTGNVNDTTTGTTPWATGSCASPVEATGVVPGSGDRINLCNGFTLAVPSGYTFTSGDQPIDDGGTPAIQCASTSGTGVLAIAGTLIARGPVRQCNSAWTASGGAIIKMDAPTPSVLTTDSENLAAGASKVVTPASMTGITTGSVLTIGDGIASEVVTVTATTGSTFTATLALAHNGTGTATNIYHQTAYTWRVGMANAQFGSKLILTGSPGNRIAVTTTGGGGQAGGWMEGTGVTTDYGFVQCYYCDISNWGTVATFLVHSSSNSTTGNDTTDRRGIVFDHTTLNNCGPISVPSLGNNSTFDVNYSLLTNPIIPVSTFSINISSSSGLASLTGGTRRINGSWIEGPVRLAAANGATRTPTFSTTSNVLRGGTGSGATPLVVSGPWSCGAGECDMNWLENRVTNASDTGNVWSGTVTRMIYTRTNGNGGGPHYVFLGSAPSVYDGWIAAAEQGNGGGGDLFQISAAGCPQAGCTLVVKNGLMLPATDTGASFGSLTNFNGATVCTNSGSAWCPAVTTTHNTFPAINANQTGVTMEGNSGVAGVHASVDSNLVWIPSSGNGWIAPGCHTCKSGDGTDAAVAGTYSVADYNWTWQLTNSGYNTSPNSAQFATTPGVHDQSGNPQFMEQRSLIGFGKRYDASVATMDDVALRIKAAMLDVATGTATGDQRFNLPDLYNWVRGGWRTRASGTWTADPVGSNVGGPTPMRMFGVFRQ